VMEYWTNGVLGQCINPLFQYSKLRLAAEYGSLIKDGQFRERVLL